MDQRNTILDKDLNQNFLNRKVLSQGCRIISNQFSIKDMTIDEFLYPVTCIALNQDSSLLITGCEDCDVRVLKLETLECVKELRGHKLAVTRVYISTDSSLIFSASYDNTLRIWNMKLGICIRSIPCHGLKECRFLSIYASLSISCYDIEFERIQTNDLKKFLAENVSVDSQTLSKDMTLIVLSDKDGLVRVIDFSSGECLKELKDHTQTVTSIAISNDNSMIVWGSIDSIIIQSIRYNSPLQILKHPKIIKSIAISNDMSMIVSGSSDGTVRVYNVVWGQYARIFKRHKFIVDSVILSQDSSKIFSLFTDGSIKMQNIIC